jgi:lysozyme
MNLRRLKNQLTADEGCKYHIYKDHLGKLTCGIGHLITKNDAEFNLPEKTPIPAWRVLEFFDDDIGNAIKSCKAIFPNFDLMCCELQEILINMMFNLGQSKFSGFKKMIKAVKEKNYFEAGRQMKDSKWFEQVPNRAARLINRMIKLEA